MTQENINSAETRRFLLRLTRSAGNTGFPIWCQPVGSYRFAQYYQTLWPPPGNPVRVQILLVTDGDQTPLPKIIMDLITIGDEEDLDAHGSSSSPMVIRSDPVVEHSLPS